jgi:peptide chain release factor subunit 1
MFEKAEQMDTDIELISADSEEGKMLLTAFSGVAAILRYRAGR